MKTSELKELRKAIRNTSKPEHSLYIEGNAFNCRWNGTCYVWTAPSGEAYKMTSKEVLKYIGKGEYITYYSYDYVA